MRVLVTGATGLVGRRLCIKLMGRGHEVTATFRSGTPTAQATEQKACELADPSAVRRLLEERPFDVVVNAAAKTQVDACEKDPEGAFADNVLATHHLAVACRATGAHFIQLSTDYVFDGQAGPYSEDALPHPISVYGYTKAMAELAVKASVPAASWAIARTAVVYGLPPARHSNFGSWLVETLSRGEPVQLFEDQSISPSLDSNVAEMLSELVERRERGIWNVCGAEVMDRVRFGRALCKTFGFDPALVVPVRLGDLPGERRPLRAGLLADKCRSQLKAQPLGLTESLRVLRSSLSHEPGATPPVH